VQLIYLRYDNCQPEPGDRLGGDTLQGETKERWRELCERIVHEQDPVRFDAAILELLEVLERDDQWRHNDGLGVPLTEKPGKLSYPV
jgi:hypothetical protein